MMEPRPEKILGRPVIDGEGRVIGVIKGLHQRSCPGGFEEVSIQNCRGVLFARVEELKPAGDGFLLSGEPLDEEERAR